MRFDDGINMDSRVLLEDDCPLSWDICGDQATFRFGKPGYGQLEMLISESCLLDISQVSADALHKIREGKRQCG